MTEKKYEIVEELGVIGNSGSSWRLELNLISWNGREPKYDIRKWSDNRESMSKGITLSQEELIKLKEILDEEIDYIQNGEN